MTKMLECQICGHKACEHIDQMVATQTEEFIKLKRILETAARIAGEKITEKDLSEDHVRRVADMILREEQMVSWMTLDERKALELDIMVRDDRIKELEKKLKELEK